MRGAYNGIDNYEKYSPPNPRSGTSVSQSLVIQDETKGNSSDNLRQPVPNVVKRTPSEVEQIEIEAVLLVGIKPVAGPEHREEEHNPVICEKGVVETFHL